MAIVDLRLALEIGEVFQEFGFPFVHWYVGVVRDGVELVEGGAGLEMVLVGGDERVAQGDDGGGCAGEFGFPI